MGQVSLPSNELEFGTLASLGLWVLRGVLLVLILSLAGCAVVAEPAQSALDFSIPAQSDWTDYGPIFKSGALGEWDYFLWGAFTGTAVKKDEIYYLYYQGARGYRTSFDETVTWRAIGVAASPDGINFTKSGANPVITWFPNSEGEEGAVSGAAALDETGEIVLYYGANTAVSATAVHADGRLATSADGLDFTDRGIVLDHRDRSVWGSGDELFPVIAFHDAGRWFVYYLPNGTPQSRKLGVAWGNGRDDLAHSSGAVSGGSAISAWGMGGSARIGPDTYALFLNDVSKRRTEVRTVSLSAPHQLSAPVETYQFDDVGQATFLLDEETKTWFMYYRGEHEYGVKLAPAGEPDTTPPTAPGSVIALPFSDREVDLHWSPATDPDTGIVLYKVFRDGVHLATIKGWNYRDTGLTGHTVYSYTVSAINYHGVEGPQSVPVTATTPVDVTPPCIVSVNASGPSSEVTIIFDEPVEQASAETPTNYAINQGISVAGASLNPDLRRVVLTTSKQTHGATYQITVDNVRDRAQNPNPIDSGTTVRYSHSTVPGLVGAWTFDEGEGETAFDSANYGNNGTLIYIEEPGPTWTDGRFGGALWFDGVDDQVTIDGSGSLENITDQSHTFAAWALADSLPPNSTPNNTSYSILVRNYTGLYYDHTGQFRARIRLASGAETAVQSDVLSPGRWHHLAMVVDDTNKKLNLYVDGQAVGNSAVDYSGPLADHEQGPYYLGTSEPLTEAYEYRFHGKIDEAQIYDRVLSQSEVERLYAGFPRSWVYLPVILRSE
jgi:hypothetical protein